MKRYCREFLSLFLPRKKLVKARDSVWRQFMGLSNSMTAGLMSRPSLEKELDSKFSCHETRNFLARAALQSRFNRPTVFFKRGISNQSPGPDAGVIFPSMR